MKKEVWQLSTNYDDSNVTLQHSGMTILNSNKDNRSVGYSNDEILQKFRLISASPELLNIVYLADKIINDENVKQWQINEFNDQLDLVKNKIKGKGKIKAPNHCRTTYDWTDEHIEKYHNKVKNLKHKI